MAEELPRELLGKAQVLLNQELCRALGEWLGIQLPPLSDDWWDRCVLSSLTYQQRERAEGLPGADVRQLDLAAILRVTDRNWNDLWPRLDLPKVARTHLKETQDIRNRWAHAKGTGIPVDDVCRDLDTVRRLADHLQLPGSLTENIGDLLEEIRAQPAAEEETRQELPETQKSAGERPGEEPGGEPSEGEDGAEQGVASRPQPDTDRDEDLVEEDVRAIHIPEIAAPATEGHGNQSTPVLRVLDYFRNCIDREELGNLVLRRWEVVPAQTPCLLSPEIRRLDLPVSDRLRAMLDQEETRAPDVRRELMYGWPVLQASHTGERFAAFYTPVEWSRSGDHLTVGRSGDGTGVEVSAKLLDLLGKTDVDERNALKADIDAMPVGKVERLAKELGFELPPEDERYGALYFSESSGVAYNLLRELGRRFGLLDPRAAGRLAQTPAQWLLGERQRAKAASPGVSHSDPPLEFFFLNSSQRDAVASALEAPLTVVTGPPGTGKSQVVLNILANAAHRRQSVLFASKNNRAVDVVRERTLASGLGPFFSCRIGNRDAMREAEDLLGRLVGELSQGKLSNDRTRVDEARSQYEQSNSVCSDIEEELAKTDELLRSVEDTKERLAEGALKWAENSRALRQGALAAKRHLHECVRCFPVDVLTCRKDLASCELPRYEIENGARAMHGMAQARDGNPFLRIWEWFVRQRVSERHGPRLDELFAALPGELGHRRPKKAPEDRLWESFAGAYEVLSELVDYQDALPKLDEAAEEREAATLAYIEGRRRHRTFIQELNAELEELEEAVRQRRADEPRLWRQLREEEVRRAALCQEWHARETEYRLAADPKARQVLSDYLGRVRKMNSRAAMNAQDFRLFESAGKEAVQVLHNWVVTSLSVRNGMPLRDGLFDLLVIDEASQCDIASALPLLFRAKRVVVIGDPLQLRHVTSLRGQDDIRIATQCGCPEMAGTFVGQSLYDACERLAHAMGTAPVFLDQHYRSCREIMEFCNRQFYAPRLGLLMGHFTPAKGLISKPQGLFWIDVGGDVPPGVKLNRAECSRAIDVAVAMASETGLTVGVATPFRDQANLLGRGGAQLRKLKVVADTVHRFQGDERDVMVFSPVISRGARKTMVEFINKIAPQLLNVAVSRARSALYVVGDRTACLAAGGLLAALAQDAIVVDAPRSTKET